MDLPLLRPLSMQRGPARLVDTKGYSTTMAISTFKKVEAKQVLRRGTSEVACMPASRVAECVFGEGGPGWSKLESRGLHIAELGSVYDPRCDSCLEAFARLW